ncbi:hypothetical protein OLCHANIL_00067 [Vibrio phage V05]|nr:hypothetical protein OLCHANIL_00067 [Vibrio phage V05]WOL24794.1 hypothetical protein [Vibrio phage PG216]
MKKTIIIDVDGVLLNWKANLPFFMMQLGMLDNLNINGSNTDTDARSLFINVSDMQLGKLIGAYNEHECAKYIPAYEDAYDALRELSDRYNIIALTKFSMSRTSWSNRVHNLNALFPGMISEVISIEYFDSKAKYVEKLCELHDVKYFIDDSLDNIREIQERFDIECIHVNRVDDHFNALKTAIYTSSIFN